MVPMLTDEEWAGLLSSALGWPVRGLAAREALLDTQLTVVERLTLVHGDPLLPGTVVAKTVTGSRTQPGWPTAAEAELHCGLLRAGAPLPHVYWAGVPRERADCSTLVMEDLAHEGRLLGGDHLWTSEELGCVVDAIGAFNAAGMEIGLAALARRYPWLAWMPSRDVNSAWLEYASEHASHSPLQCADPGIPQLLRRIAERYDGWLQSTMPWHTTIHHDAIGCNAALFGSVDAPSTAKLMDVGDTRMGLLHLDPEWCRMAGRWQTDADWDALRSRHLRSVARHSGAGAPDEQLWWWAYGLARLQIALSRQRDALAVLEKGGAATERERAWIEKCLAHGPLFDAVFGRTCEAVLDQCPLR